MYAVEPVGSKHTESGYRRCRSRWLGRKCILIVSDYPMSFVVGREG